MAKIKNPFKKLDTEEVLSLARGNDKMIVGSKIVLYSHKEHRNVFCKKQPEWSITDKGVGFISSDLFIVPGTGKKYKETGVTYLKAILWVDLKPTNLIQRVLYGTRRLSIDINADSFGEYANEDFEVTSGDILDWPSFNYTETQDISDLDEHETHEITLIETREYEWN